LVFLRRPEVPGFWSCETVQRGYVRYNGEYVLFCPIGTYCPHNTALETQLFTRHVTVYYDAHVIGNNRVINVHTYMIQSMLTRTHIQH
jgi:hypothetical protein